MWRAYHFIVQSIFEFELFIFRELSVTKCEEEEEEEEERVVPVLVLLGSSVARFDIVDVIGLLTKL